MAGGEKTSNTIIRGTDLVDLDMQCIHEKQIDAESSQAESRW